jgi:glutathione S-transferase
MSTIKLYNFPLSGNCYKIRLLLSMLKMDYETIPIDIAKGETLTTEFKQMNPRGQLPVLVDGDDLMWDSMAILVYLARRYGGTQWLPADALGEARVMQWLAVSENELLYGLARARATLVLKRPFNLEACHADAKPGVIAMENQLSQQEWLAAEHPTIADIACYPYVMLADQGDFSLQPYAAVRSWLERVESIPGWVAMLKY